MIIIRQKNYAEPSIEVDSQKAAPSPSQKRKVPSKLKLEGQPLMYNQESFNPNLQRPKINFVSPYDAPQEYDNFQGPAADYYGGGQNVYYRPQLSQIQMYGNQAPMIPGRQVMYDDEEYQGEEEY